jgi:hypothetical protein
MSKVPQTDGHKKGGEFTLWRKWGFFLKKTRSKNTLTTLGKHHRISWTHRKLMV